MNTRILKDIRSNYIFRYTEGPTLYYKKSDRTIYIAVNKIHQEVSESIVKEDVLHEVFTNTYGLFYANRLVHILKERNRKKRIKNKAKALGINTKQLKWL